MIDLSEISLEELIDEIMLNTKGREELIAIKPTVMMIPPDIGNWMDIRGYTVEDILILASSAIDQK